MAGSGDTGNTSRGFIYQNGVFTLIGTLPGGIGSSAVAINDSGQVTGNADVPSGAHAFLYTAGQLQDLGVLPGGGANSYAGALNSAGDVVGQADDPNGNSLAFVVYANGTMQDLNGLIPSNSGWQLQQATGINDAGEIAGVGVFHSSPTAYALHSFILKPVCSDHGKDHDADNDGDHDGNSHDKDKDHDKDHKHKHDHGCHDTK
ncbi:MAG: hypothetical protein WA785_10805 [Candidatus Acidiferrales bacterium]